MVWSQSPQAGQFNSYICEIFFKKCSYFLSLNPLKRVNSILTNYVEITGSIDSIRSQSPQAGQFNSYIANAEMSIPRMIIPVSIPSSGSIQFLPRFSSLIRVLEKSYESQSPQAGQFNSYVKPMAKQSFRTTRKVSIPSSGSIQFLRNPEKKVSPTVLKKVSIPSSGSIQFLHVKKLYQILRPTLKSQSPQAGQFNSYLAKKIDKRYGDSLNPLKRVNSILTFRNAF